MLQSEPSTYSGDGKASIPSPIAPDLRAPLQRLLGTHSASTIVLEELETDLDSGRSLVHRRFQVMAESGSGTSERAADRPAKSPLATKGSRRLVIPLPLAGGRLLRVTLDFPNGFPAGPDQLLPIVKDVERLAAYF